MIKFFCDSCGKEIKISEVYDILINKRWEPKETKVEITVCNSCYLEFIDMHRHIFQKYDKTI